MTFHEIHPKFKLNGHSYTKEELSEVAYSLVKEGLPFEQQIGDFLMDWLNNKEQIEMRTSGSTGEPKTFLMQKEKMVKSALATAEYFRLQPGDKALMCLPVTYIAGKMMLVRAMIIGLHLECVAPTSSPLTGIRKKYDFCAMVPLQLQSSLNDLEGIKTLIIGGAPISAPLKRQVQGMTTNIYETYGMTETVSHVAVKRVNHVLASHEPSLSEMEGFHALPDITFSQDPRGCLVIEAPGLLEHPLVTNDMVKLISEKTFMWLGRYDHIINSGGIKLNPEQIEDKLSPGIDCRFLIAGLPDERLGQKLVLVLESKDQAGISLQNLAKTPNIEKYEMPKEVYHLAKFEETGNGKVQREKTIANLIRSLS
jgi:O-succinylbenzoic acid--CoA ligase